MSFVLGMEIGGTKLQWAIGRGDRKELVVVQRLPARSSEGAQAIRVQIQQALPLLFTEAAIATRQIKGVGIGFGGPVHADLSTVTKSHQVSGWENFHLGAWIEETFGWPTVVHNDADTAALAESRFGAGQGFNPIFYVTIGSGIGGGLILDDKIYRGAGAGAGELGHMRVPAAIVSSGGASAADDDAWVTVESICSGWSIARRAQQYIAAGVPTRLRNFAERDRGEITTESVARAALQGDGIARQLLDETCRALAIPIAQMITLLCPPRVVIGGGVAHLGEELLFRPLRREVAKLVFPPFADLYEIVPAALGDEVVLYGALALAHDQFGR